MKEGNAINVNADVGANCILFYYYIGSHWVRIGNSPRGQTQQEKNIDVGIPMKNIKYFFFLKL